MGVYPHELAQSMRLAVRHRDLFTAYAVCREICCSLQEIKDIGVGELQQNLHTCFVLLRRELSRAGYDVGGSTHPDDIARTLAQRTTCASAIETFQEVVRHAPEIAAQEHGQSFPLAERAKDFIESNFQEPISLDSVAGTLGCSSAYLIRAFKAAHETTPARFIRLQRVRFAKMLLQNTDLRAGEIANEAGFRSYRTFARVFASETGMSPRQYRQSRVLPGAHDEFGQG